MCGIYGVAGKNLVNEKELINSVNKLEHRGPDDSGFYISGEIAIGMRRLAINELSTGHQPFIDKTKTIGVVFNGEIYNYKVLTTEEHLPEHTSEAELISHLYIKYGPDFVKMLDGMFAIAIAEFLNKKIVLFRDPFGKKPLWVYVSEDKSIEFSSEIKAFRGPKTIRKDFVSEYLTFGYVPLGNSPFVEISSVPAGSYLTWWNGNITKQKYWSPNSNIVSKIDYRSSKEEIKKLLQKAVFKRLISERPVGVYLSGGYDSSVIAAMMKTQNAIVNSYSIGFDINGYDESKYAQQVANQLGTTHHQQILDINIESLVKEVYAKMDLPFADSSILPTYLLNKFAKNEIVVALGGDGGDEIFGGYDRYLWAPRINKLRFLFKWFPKKIPGNSSKIQQMNRKLKRLSQEMSPDSNLASRYLNVMSLIKIRELRKISRIPISDALFMAKLDLENSKGSDLRRMMLWDVDNYLLGDLLFKADLASMFNSIELRSPFLDKELAEYVYSLPDNYLVTGLKTKRILKEIAHELVPKKILKRPKMGFGVPMADWLRSDLRSFMNETFTKNREILDSWIDMSYIEDLALRHQNKEDHSRTLWPVLALALWAENNL